MRVCGEVFSCKERKAPRRVQGAKLLTAKDAKKIRKGHEEGFGYQVAGTEFREERLPRDAQKAEDWVRAEKSF